MDADVMEPGVATGAGRRVSGSVASALGLQSTCRGKEGGTPGQER